MITYSYGTVTGGRLNLRTSADASSSIQVQIPDETLLIVTDCNESWYQTSFGPYSGFSMKQYITLLDLENANELSGEVTGGSLNLRRSASTSSFRVLQIPDGTVFTVIDYDPTCAWYITEYNGYCGYVLKNYVDITTPVISEWAYGQVNVNELNVRRQPSTSADRWNDVWPRNRIVLIKEATDGWYESLYRGQPAYVVKDYINVLSTPVHSGIVERMLFMVTPELGRDDVTYFNGYSGEWCHRFADWLAMNAGIPVNMIPNDSNCGTGMVWFINNLNSGGFHFKNATHKKRFINNYHAVDHLSPSLSPEEVHYIPTPGDYIYFRWKNADRRTNVSHVGIVATVCENSLTTWEGNSGGTVVNRTFALNDPQIVGYGKPKYHEA